MHALTIRSAGWKEPETWKERERRRQARVGFPRRRTGVRSSDEDAWKWPPRGDVLRRREAAGAYSGKDAEEGART